MLHFILYSLYIHAHNQHLNVLRCTLSWLVCTQMAGSAAVCGVCVCVCLSCGLTAGLSIFGCSVRMCEIVCV